MLTNQLAAAFIAFYGAQSIHRKNQHRPEVYHFVFNQDGTPAKLVAVQPTGFEMEFAYAGVVAECAEYCNNFTIATDIPVIKCNKVRMEDGQTSAVALDLLNEAQKLIAEAAAESNLVHGKREQGYYFDNKGNERIDRWAQNGFGGKDISWVGGWKDTKVLAEMVPIYNEKGLTVGMVHPKGWEYSGSIHFSALGLAAFQTQVAVAAIENKDQQKALQDAFSNQLHTVQRKHKETLYYGPIGEAILKGCDGDNDKKNGLLHKYGN